MRQKTARTLFALGAEGMMAGALPPTGVYLLSYYQNYHASEFQNGPDQFHVDVNAVVPRLVWMTDQKNYGWTTRVLCSPAIG